jgi:ATP-dependent exoDNAse (exonuclease V) beta subunit
MQWKNFIPLVGDSVAYGNENLVVGDVKQSIYRWRNSDWKILAHKIKDEYGANCDEETLEDNWRSLREIVNFNNVFFKKLVEGLDNEIKNEEDKIANVYSDVKQTINPKREEAEGGYVNWKVWNDAPKGEKIDFQEKELQALYNDINEVLSKGFSLKDIGILVRDKKKGVVVSKYLLEKGINVISSESLLVSSSNDVRLLVYLLKVLSNKNEEINNFILESLRPSTPSGEPNTNCVEPKANCGEPNANCGENNAKTPNNDDKSSIITEEIRKASKLPLFEQIEKFIQILKLNKRKESIVYIQAFQDLVFDYNQKHSSDVEGFLSWWELEGKNISIEGGSGVNAVNILTIHKSKGLDFPVVFVPFCEWPLSVNNEVKWFRNKATGFTNYLPLLPIKVTKDLDKTSFAEEYNEEMRYKKIDNLNLIYVALTRPRSALYVYSAPGNNHEVYKWVSAVLSNFPCNNSLEEEEIMEYSFGKLAYLNVEKKTVEAVPCDCDYASVDYNAKDSKVNLRFQTESSLRQREGSVLHGILQFVKTKEDVSRAINRAVRMGLISSRESGDKETELKDLVKNPLVSEWFDGTYPVVWNERTIISDKNYRPDRIMEKDGELLVVDYKFGEKNTKYYAQLRNYVKLLKQMNKWSNVRGCLYFHETKSLQWV